MNYLSAESTVLARALSAEYSRPPIRVTSELFMFKISLEVLPYLCQVNKITGMTLEDITDLF